MTSCWFWTSAIKNKMFLLFLPASFSLSVTRLTETDELLPAWLVVTCRSWWLLTSDPRRLWALEISRSWDEFAACGLGQGGHNTGITALAFYCRGERERGKEECIIPHFNFIIVWDLVLSLLAPSANCHRGEIFVTRLRLYLSGSDTIPDNKDISSRDYTFLLYKIWVNFIWEILFE